MQQGNKQNWDEQMNQYFSKLPPLVQESILQSGAPFDDLAQLQAFVQALTQKG